jgi:hypothetical protein
VSDRVSTRYSNKRKYEGEGEVGNASAGKDERRCNIADLREKVYIRAGEKW